MSNNGILFFSEEISFTPRNKKILRSWINASIELENKLSGSINYIFCSDNYLHNINIKYLNHNTLTDIITFNTSSDENVISSDIYLSIDRIKENAKQYKVTFVNELHRVMIHGILHLVGYNDKTDSEKNTMRSKEDYYLTLLSKSLRG